MESFGNIFNEEWHHFAKQGVMPNECDLGLIFENPSIFSSFSDNSSNVDTFEHFVNVTNENNISSNDASNATMSLSYGYHDGFPFCSSNTYNLDPLPNDVVDESIKHHTINEINNSLLATEVPFDGRLKRKIEMLDLPYVVDDEVQKNEKNWKKRIRVNKTKANVQSKKDQEMKDIENEYNNNGAQSSSSCSFNDDCNGSQDINGAINTNGKTRASRGNATDPQSLYARKRRERINERLRILQNLVPNGTKVDISTMLEEAVEYVKFLKLQIQLLSSDEMWMYAPIAYNGMDMGLYKNITQNL